MKTDQPQFDDASPAPRPNRLSRQWMLVLLAVAVPIVPFVLFGSWLEPWITAAIESNWFAENPLQAAGIAIGLLIADLFLPVPSSAVCTLTGSVLGIWWGAVVSWVGLNLGAALGYHLARFLSGRWRVDEDRGLVEARYLERRWGAWSLLLFRGVPVLAEASVIMAGLNRLPWRQFWIPVASANLGLALAYAVWGDWAQRNQWLAPTLGIAVGLPLVIWMGTRWIVRNSESR